MKYPTVFADKAFVDACRVKGWPTFCLIDPDDKIIFSKAVQLLMIRS